MFVFIFTLAVLFLWMLPEIIDKWFTRHLKQFLKRSLRM